MHTPKIIALDMDGTTLKNDHASLSPRNRAAIEAAIAKGIIVAFATGRMRYRLPESVESISGVRYAITSNGAVVNDLLEDRILYERSMPIEIFLRVLDILEDQGVYMDIYCGGKAYTPLATDYIWKNLPIPPHRLEMMSRNRLVVESMRDFALEENHPIEKVNLPFLTDQDSTIIRKRLQALGSVAITSSVAHNLEINALGTNKADGLSHLCDLLGIAPVDVMAIGDNDNDLEMLEFAGFSVVPENGLENCISIADFVTASNEDDGVAIAIERYAL